ncbi:MAG: caspase family protein [Pseudomonadota bacterium]
MPGLLGLGLIMTGCTTGPHFGAGAGSDCAATIQPSAAPAEALRHADELLIVDCLLPGQLIGIGQHQNWLTPPRPARLPIWNCKLQGGQYVAFDRANRDTALKVWLACAERGDKIAQNYVGEIYEKGWGVGPDYAKAAEWYKKAAFQGYARARSNLAFLYEQGRGVPKNPQEALKLYREAMGLRETIAFDEPMKREIDALREKLSRSVKENQSFQQRLQETQALLNQERRRVNELRRNTSRATDANSSQALLKQLQEARNREKRLHKRLSTLKQQVRASKTRAARYRDGIAEKETVIAVPRNMGRYYALIIGINQYRPPLERLKTAVNDAKAVEKLLRSKYGFKTVLLTDETPVKPTRDGIITALHKLNGQLSERDNLVIYYAGQGVIQNQSRYHWLAQDADSTAPATWISTDDIDKAIETTNMPARHVLVIVDSCYSAALATRSAPENLGGPGSDEARLSWIRSKAEKISRTALTSGGIEPVLHRNGSKGLSIFAKALTDALENNHRIISAQNIHQQIEPQVVAFARKYGSGQRPVYARINGTGDNHGEFFFLPNTAQARQVETLYALTKDRSFHPRLTAQSTTTGHLARGVPIWIAPEGF